MKNQRLCIIVLLSMCFTCIRAQKDYDHVSNIVVSVSPFGKSFLHIDDKDYYEYQFNFNSLFSIGVHKEKDAGVCGYMWGVTYTHAKYHDYKSYDNSPTLNNVNFNSFNNISLEGLFGINFRHTHRLKFPVYIGLSADYINAGPCRTVTLGLEAKARAKYYISNKVGMFVGGTWHGLFGGKCSKEYQKYGLPTSKDPGFTANMWGIETGILFSIN